MNKNLKHGFVCIAVILIGSYLYFGLADMVHSTMMLDLYQTTTMYLMTYTLFLGLGFPILCALGEILSRKFGYHYY